MFTNYEQLETFFNERKSLGIKPGLERINQLLDITGNPQDKIKAVHVAGTNGKGSTITFLKNALVHNHYKVGTFISPSLDGLTGHIFCNDEKITTDQLISFMNIIYPAIQQLDESNQHPTEFEIITVLAFIYFAHHVDIALIETGMGGREDTTNCFKPILSMITNVDLDHTSFLGETVQEIAHHKAGIIKENIPVVIGDVSDQVFTVLQKEAHIKRAPVYRLFDHFTYTTVRQKNQQQSFKWSENKEVPFEVTIQMYGEHQVKNSSLAIMALVYLKKQGYAIDSEKVFIGLKQTIVPGRFEVIQTNPTIILDGAHNPAGVQSFLDTVTKNYENAERHLIFAAFKDKDLKQMLEQLLPHFSTVTFTSFDHPRAASGEDLYNLVTYTENQKYFVEDLKTIINDFVQPSNREQRYYFITGSLHFIALVGEYFRTEKGGEQRRIKFL